MIKKKIQITIDVDLIIDQAKGSKAFNDSIEKTIVAISEEVDFFPTFYKVRKNKSSEEFLSSGESTVSVRIDGNLVSKESFIKNIKQDE